MCTVDLPRKARPGVCVSSISFVDLAGSERASQAAAEGGDGEKEKLRQKEVGGALVLPIVRHLQHTLRCMIVLKVCLHDYFHNKARLILSCIHLNRSINRSIQI